MKAGYLAPAKISETTLKISGWVCIFQLMVLVIYTGLSDYSFLNDLVLVAHIPNNSFSVVLVFLWHVPELLHSYLLVMWSTPFCCYLTVPSMGDWCPTSWKELFSKLTIFFRWNVLIFTLLHGILLLLKDHKGSSGEAADEALLF